MKFHCRTVN